ncbi:YraN family protein [Eoetvoesiella caeni]|uniref:UPF0102 protein DFR37_107144 n=1 Tax=Eoetvoesiella caeni TaxID=645616 RepID=A0A366H9A1_9BURK|nr:YraN family protein [Eoetvoesiella caeni]MCI2809763.1 YraN family protein [Eoetvoesiella caeni]NYT56322.1 YraN family protein [Eoetvoesiella caeni]RBP38380.1 putative endonuclease [Eoetvoesiella caeni]
MMDEDCAAYARARAAQEKAVRRRKKRQQAARQPRVRAAPAQMQLSPTQKAGCRAEDQAKEYLESAGLGIVARNLRGKTGEIDLVCLDGAILVFVEVRHRHSARYGGAAASVNRRKQQRLVNTAALLLPALVRQCRLEGTPACRFDVIAIEAGGLAWIKNAFCAS